MTFEYITYEGSRKAELHSLDYDVNIEKIQEISKSHKFPWLFLHLPTTLINHSISPGIERIPIVSQWQHGKFLQIKADSDFAKSTLFYDKKAKNVILTVQGQRKWITHTKQSPRRIQNPV